MSLVGTAERIGAARDGAHYRALASWIALRQTVRMMSESQALETLSREDPEAAGDARAALAWLTGDEGLETISLLRLQEFLWYALPVKWPMSTPGRVGVAKALGRLFLLAGFGRDARGCSSAGHGEVNKAH